MTLALDLEQWPKCTTRTNVMPADSSYIHAFATGLVHDWGTQRYVVSRQVAEHP